MKFVSINNKIWGLGLHWRLIPAQKLSRQEYINKAQNLDANFDLICRHKGQYGFGVSGVSGISDTSSASIISDIPNINDNALKLPSAFSLAAYLHIPELIAIFKLEDLGGIPFWWVLAIRHNTIVGTGDQVYDNEKDAEDAILNLNELLQADLEDTIVCKTSHESIEWLSPQLRLNFLENLLGSAKITPLIEDIQKKRKKIIVFALVAIALFIGSWSISSYYLEQKAMKEQRLAYQNREQIKRNLLAKPEKQFKQEWAKLPLASDIATSCLNAMQNISTNINGWKLDSLSCIAGKSLQLTWTHQAGANFIDLPMKASLKTPKQAISRLKIATVLPIRPKQKHIELLPTNELMSIFYQICQATGTKVKPVIKKPRTQTINKVQIICPWQKIEWTLSQIPSFLISDRSELAQILAKIPGLSLNKITFQNGIWTFSGSAYALKIK